jgi:hypothetical protein
MTRCASANTVRAAPKQDSLLLTTQERSLAAPPDSQYAADEETAERCARSERPLAVRVKYFILLSLPGSGYHLNQAIGQHLAQHAGS